VGSHSAEGSRILTMTSSSFTGNHQLTFEPVRFHVWGSCLFNPFTLYLFSHYLPGLNYQSFDMETSARMPHLQNACIKASQWA
jgi:hypothetical protein